jgi:hypothetical protein
LKTLQKKLLTVILIGLSTIANAETQQETVQGVGYVEPLDITNPS